MPVDEFGREIPAARGRRSPSPQRSGSGSGSGLPSHLYDSLPTSRYDAADPGHHHRPEDSRGHPSSSSRKRKHRSRSPPPRRDRGEGHHRDRESGSGFHHPKPGKAHPSVVYVEEPMLCQFLWKEANEGKTDEDYDEYRKSYCLNYVRTFFNEHMDDSWFRSLYSPLARYEVARQELDRAAREAGDFAGDSEEENGLREPCRVETAEADSDEEPTNKEESGADECEADPK